MLQKSFGKIQQAFMIKTLNKIGIEENLFNMTKDIYEKPIANIKLNGERVKDLPLITGTREGHSLSQLLFNIVLKVLTKKIK